MKISSTTQAIKYSNHVVHKTFDVSMSRLKQVYFSVQQVPTSLVDNTIIACVARIAHTHKSIDTTVYLFSGIC